MLLACLCPSGAAAGAEEGRLVRHLVVGDVTRFARDIDLDPVNTLTSEIGSVFRDMFDQLVLLDADGSIVPGAARSWEILEGGSVYEFQLDEGGRWSDGEAVTARDFVFAWSRQRDPEFAPHTFHAFAQTIRGWALDSDEPFGVRALDDFRLRIELVEPYALALEELKFGYFSPLPEHAAPRTRAHWVDWERRPSNGPYRIESSKGNELNLVANPFYKDGPPAIGKVTHLFSTWAEASRSLFDGKADVVMSVSLRQIHWLMQNTGYHVEPRDPEFSFYALNSRAPGLTDPRVRHALRLAVDRERLVDEVLDGNAAPAHGVIRPGYGGYVPGFSPPPYSQALAEAKRLMNEAGYSQQRRLHLVLSNDDDETHVQVALSVARDWSQIFVDLDFAEPMASMHDLNSFQEQGTYEVTRRRWILGYLSPRDFIQSCEVLKPVHCGYPDPALYVPFARHASAETDPVERNRLFQQAELGLLEQNTIVPLFHTSLFALMSGRVEATEGNDFLNSIMSRQLRWRAEDN